MGRTEGTGSGKEEHTEVIFHKLLCRCPGAKTFENHMGFNFSSKGSSPLPQNGELKEAFFCLYSLSFHPWNKTRASQISGPLPAICRSAMQGRHLASSSIAPYCTRGGQGLFSLDGSLSTGAMFTWTDCFSDLSPASQEFHNSRAATDIVNKAPETGLKPRPDDTCSRTYPKPSTGCVTPVHAFDLSRLQFMRKRRKLRWDFPKILSSSVILWSNCSHVTLSRKGNVSSTFTRAISTDHCCVSSTATILKTKTKTNKHLAWVIPKL